MIFFIIFRFILWFFFIYRDKYKFLRLKENCYKGIGRGLCLFLVFKFKNCILRRGEGEDKNLEEYLLS